MEQDNGKFTVLVVDDDPSVRMLVPNLLRSKGFETIKASNGCEAIEQTQSRRPDLILLDINMPEMNGLEACAKIKESADTADIPVIFMTSLGNDSDRLKGFEVGGEDYVIKPINHHELLARMQRFVDAKQRPRIDAGEVKKAVKECLTEIGDPRAAEQAGTLPPAVGKLLDCLQALLIKCNRPN